MMPSRTGSVEDIDEIDFGSGQPLHAADAARRLLGGQDDETPAFATPAAPTPASTTTTTVKPPMKPAGGGGGGGGGSSSLFERIRAQQQQKQQQQQQPRPKGPVDGGYKAPLPPTGAEQMVVPSQQTSTAMDDKPPITTSSLPTMNGHTTDPPPPSGSIFGSTNDFAPVPTDDTDIESPTTNTTNTPLYEGSLTNVSHDYSYASPPAPPSSYSSPPPPRFEPMMVSSSVQKGLRTMADGMNRLGHSLSTSLQGLKGENSSPLLSGGGGGGSDTDEDFTRDVEYSMTDYMVTFLRDMYGVTLGRLSPKGRMGVLVAVGILLFLKIFM